MSSILEFAVLVIVISASGVMAPGPLFATNIVYGLKEGTRSGIKIAIGHTIVELPLIILLGIGVFSLELIPEFQMIISIFGAIALFVFAIIQIKKIFETNKKIQSNQKHSPIIAGIGLTALNPFFIIWWLTIGFKLISDAMLIWAFSGIVILFLFHIWMDFAWLGITAFLASKSLKILSNRSYKVLMTILSLTLIYFGITFLIEL